MEKTDDLQAKDSVIVVEDAVKRYDAQTVLQHVNVSFKKGRIYGIIGRNGSGKTVLFKSICGFVTLDSGRIFVRGKQIGKDEDMAQDVGMIIENPGFLPGYSAFRNLKFLAMLKKKINEEQIRETIRKVGLDPDSRKKVGKFSMGMRQRLGIAQAVMEDPDILILDEPFNGLDKQGVDEMRSLLLELKGRGKTILLASHNSEDIRVLCDHVYEMDGGNLEQMS
ncbi:MAG: ATP-binding cassette domain-containing protein [Lachnospiraceae bacterium]|nr:ATP-binding cassette domain-containing protein [Lachnospiraceae bacterium]